jgi:putative ABC transport system permease protein
MKLFNLGWKLLISRKKWLFLITISLALIIAVTISIFTASESIKESLKENALENFGEHSGLLTNVNETKKAISKKTDSVGQYQLTGSINIDNKKVASVGWMDADAVMLGKISLIKGSLPSKGNEVAIESSYLRLIDPNWKIGEEKALCLNNTKTNVTLSGIVKDYSSQWSVPYELERGVNDLPNIFIPVDKETIGSTTNFLFKFSGSKKKVEEKTFRFLDNYSENGIFNENLYYKGLIDHDNITLVSFIFQLLTIITSLFCIVSLFSYFNTNQYNKIAIIKAIGSNNINIFKIHLFQIIIIFFISLLISIPFQVIFYFLIIKNSFNQGLFSTLNLFFIFSIVICWLIIIFLCVLFGSFRSITKVKHYSVNELLRRDEYQQSSINHWTRNIKTFTVKQLIIQLFAQPKHAVFTVFTLTLSLLIITFSLFLQKESAGIWDADEDYFISAQETYGYDTIDNLNVLLNEGITFSPQDVKRLENTDGITRIEKDPFMMDVHPLMKPEIVTPSIHGWINHFGPSNNKFHDLLIIPNISYVLIDKRAFKEIYRGQNYENFRDKVIITLPVQYSEGARDTLKGRHVNFVKKTRKSEELKTTEWEFEIYDVMDNSFNKTDNPLHIDKDEFTFIMDEQSAIDNGLFQGYKDLTIYTKNNLDNEEKQTIENLVHDMVSTIPGSLYQNLATFRIEDTKISSFVGLLGKMAFVVAVILSVVSVIALVFNKYQNQKRLWGIYLSLGMNKKQVLIFLILEITLYFGISVILSMIVFLLTMSLLDYIYPFILYLEYYFLAVIFLAALLLIGCFLLKKLINKQSIFSLIRIEE